MDFYNNDGVLFGGCAGLLISAFPAMIIGSATNAGVGILVYFACVAASIWIGGLIGEQGIKKRNEEERRQLELVNSLDDAYSMTPTDFEKLVAMLFRRMGYQTSLTKATGDEGIDIRLQKNGNTELVQCKRYKGTVSVKTVRELYGVVIDKRAHKGLVVTTGNFSMPAKQFAQGKPIQLIDGAELAEWIVSINKKEATDEK